MPADLLPLLRCRVGLAADDTLRDRELMMTFRGARRWLENHVDRPVIDAELDGVLLAGALMFFDVLWEGLHQSQARQVLKAIASDGQRIEFFAPQLSNGLPTMALAMLQAFRRMAC